MVLVDTSIWIRHISGSLANADALDDLLAQELVLGHPLVFGELLIGDRGGRSRLLNAYQLMRELHVVPHSEVVAFVSARRLNGLGIGWIDAHLLASCLVAGAKLWTADAALISVAESLGIGFAA
ncbi:MAG: type II toxin-antitoxin system VapC family toxin [Fimbriimonas sp.]